VQTTARPTLTNPRLGDERLSCRYAATQDPELRAQLVERYMPLARYAASRFAGGVEPFDDLQQVATVGLLKAIDRFDPHRGASFASYALPTMVGELKRYFRDRSWTVRPPRDLQDDALKVERITQELQLQNGVPPTIDAIACRCDMTDEAVLEARQALRGRHAASLSSTSGDEQLSLDQRLGVVDDGFIGAERRAYIATLTATLTAREREIVRLRFEEDLTQAEIGTIVGVSQMHVSRLLVAALAKLRLAAGATVVTRPLGQP
jgi:RNA polymerase sigma-B factor